MQITQLLGDRESTANAPLVIPYFLSAVHLLVGVFTCFEFVYISFYFQTSQEKIKPSLLTQRTVSRGQRVQVSGCGVKHFHFNDISDSVAVSDH